MKGSGSPFSSFGVHGRTLQEGLSIKSAFRVTSHLNIPKLVNIHAKAIAEKKGHERILLSFSKTVAAEHSQDRDPMANST